MRDDDVRSACFAALDVLQAKWGADVPYTALADGFNFRDRRVPFLNRAYGIYGAAGVQRGAAAPRSQSPAACADELGKQLRANPSPQLLTRAHCAAENPFRA